MTRNELDHAMFHGLDACKDFERGIVEAMTPQEALVIASRVQTLVTELQAIDLAAHNRADVLCGMKERLSAQL